MGVNICQHATFTTRPWIAAASTCVIVECRAQEVVENPSVLDFYQGVRRACDEKFNLIPNADYVMVRSRYCNPKCPFYKGEDK